MSAALSHPSLVDRSAAAMAVLQDLSCQGVAVRSLTSDSRAVQPGDVFLAYPGDERLGKGNDGRRYIGDAIARGAAAIVAEKQGLQERGAWAVPYIATEELKPLAGWLADAVYGAPSRELRVVGITGTSGKTSCATWLAEALQTLSAAPAGLIGTTGYGLVGALQPNPNTTPDAIVVHRELAALRRAGAHACAMEVTSIGLDQGRVNGVHFAAALFTNLSRDHLDYHRDMDEYRDAKALLFQSPTLPHAIINADDAAGNTLSMGISKACQITAYGSGAHTLARAAQFAPRFAPQFAHARNLSIGAQGATFTFDTSWGQAAVRTPIVTDFNITNLVGVGATLLAMGFALPRVVDVMATLTPPVGRMEVVSQAHQPLVMVDYAHKPDALEKALMSASSSAAARGGQLWVVFGAGGNRDKGKRPMMGEVAARLAQHVVLTSDNPRDEDPAQIIAEIAAGMPHDSAVIEPDRAAAIGYAIAHAKTNDVVVIAGKGHENTQERAGIKTPFSDQNVARAALQDWGQA
jgi:UDP-N-acetylmuramoyl-L-alanyl-D-glutamate--2,6-diaminopimelate ligase